MSKYSHMAGALRREMDMASLTLRDVADRAELAPTTVMRATQKPIDLHYSTILRLWTALGFSVTIYCQKEGAKKMYVFEED